MQRTSSRRLKTRPAPRLSNLWPESLATTSMATSERQAGIRETAGEVELQGQSALRQKRRARSQGTQPPASAQRRSRFVPFGCQHGARKGRQTYPPGPQWASLLHLLQPHARGKA
jgi:hypothetical protein